MDKWLNHPTAIKIISLVVGIIMWAVVHFDSDSTPNNVASLVETRTINDVKIEATGLDERSYTLKGIEPQTVKLTVKGTQSDIRLARKEDYDITVNLTGLSEGIHSLSPRLDLPRGIQLVEMVPGTVTVVIEALHTKEFTVDIQAVGSPAEGYIAGAPVIKPTNRAHVTLPENTLSQVARVGAALSIDGQKEAIHKKSVKLAAYDASGNVIEGAIIDPAVVEVEIPITSPYKMVPVQFVLEGTLPSGLSIGNFKPDAEQVTIYGSKETLEKIEFAEAHLQLTQLSKSGRVEIPLVINDSVTEISPANIGVEVEVVLSDTRMLEGIPINWKGLGEGLTLRVVEPSTGKADIVVRGSPARLGSLQPGDVSVDADLTGKGPGTHEVSLVINAPRFIERSGGTTKATVEIVADVPASVDLEEGQEPQEPAEEKPEEASKDKAEEN